MRNLLYLALLFTIPTFAKENENQRFIYASTGLGGGNFFSMRADLNYMNQNTFFSAGIGIQTAQASNVPNDFDAGHVTSVLGWPSQDFIAINMLIGKVIPTHTTRIRYILKGGISAALYNSPRSYTRDTATFKGWHYNIDYRQQGSVGLLLNPTVEFPFLRGFGASAGCWANINPFRTTYGVETCLLFGKLRPRTKKHDKMKQ